MEHEHLGRRQVLTAAGAGLVAAAGLGGTAAAAPARSHSSDGDDDSIAGGWMIIRTDSGSTTPVRTVVTFADGGAAMALDIDPGSPPLAGSWEAEEDDSLKVTFWGTATDESGRGVGIVRVRVTGHVDGHRIAGTYRVRATVQGQNQTGTGSFRGTRIDAD
jgi:hypothetical protein